MKIIVTLLIAATVYLSVPHTTQAVNWNSAPPPVERPDGYVWSE